MKCVLEEKGQELYHRELRVGLDSSQVNTHKEPQKVGKLLNVAARDKKTKDDIRNLATSFLEENLTKHSLSSELYKHTFPVKNTKACTSYPRHRQPLIPLSPKHSREAAFLLRLYPPCCYKLKLTCVPTHWCEHPIKGKRLLLTGAGEVTVNSRLANLERQVLAGTDIKLKCTRQRQRRSLSRGDNV